MTNWFRLLKRTRQVTTAIVSLKREQLILSELETLFLAVFV